MRISASLLVGSAVATLLGVLPASAPRAQPPATEPTVHCVDLRRIDHTEIAGDRTILFYLTDRTIYQNQLPHACPGLLRGEPFMYRVAVMQLCDTDVVTVLERWGFGAFTPTESCLLGPFTRIDAATAGALKAASRRRDRDPAR